MSGHTFILVLRHSTYCKMTQKSLYVCHTVIHAAIAAHPMFNLSHAELPVFITALTSTNRAKIRRETLSAAAALSADDAAKAAKICSS